MPDGLRFQNFLLPVRARFGNSGVIEAVKLVTCRINVDQWAEVHKGTLDEPCPGADLHEAQSELDRH